ncbi:HEAT repeat-containing protein 6 [Megachile rotundata]|uniref:HEAT repeat-containing protein 6 n=1 Tax=Megachile rotundata TaxID=143995 RepID=UPI003FD42297
MALTQADYPNNAAKFDLAIEKLIALTKKEDNKTKLINNYLCNLNELDYRYITISNKNAVQLLIKQLCAVATPTETVLVQNLCKFLTTLIQNNIEVQEETFVHFKKWILEAIRLASSAAHNNIFLALKSILANNQFNDINQDLQLLLEENQLLIKYLNQCSTEWTEIHYNAIGCLEGILVNINNSTSVTKEFVYIVKDVILNIISSSLCVNDNKLIHIKILCSCLHILHIITINRLIPHSTDFMGEILGVIQAFLFYGIKDYPPMRPEFLRPAVMNLPERIHIIPKCKNLKNHKAKLKKQPIKKATEIKNSIVPECKGVSIYSSDSDTSDTESNNSVLMNSKVRLETVYLLQALIETSQSREMFGFWPQIVATGSRSDARVLTRCILKESVSKVKQHMLSTLTELLTDAKPFLMHAEDVQHKSFITFFGTVCLMIKELHFTLSLILSSESNIAVLTHTLKCAAALIQGTPYARLKVGLATKLMRNCRPCIFHKDPTVRIAALSAFEAIASCDPITPEIFEILGKQSTMNIELDQLHLNISSNDNTDDQEEEIDAEDLKNNMVVNYNNKLLEETNICFLVHVCLENISNKILSTPVRLQSLKLIGRMVFSTRNLVFPYIELVTTTLIAAVQDSETQVILHTCRALEIMAGCLINSDFEDNNATVFWNIIFEPMILLLQHQETIIREAACDCLGSISSTVFTQLPRQKAVLIITVIFGAVHDKESAVRAAALRALGMLVTLPALKEETGFLMDLADIVCLTADDKNLGVRIKGAWALANLCNCLSEEKDQEELVEHIPLEILLPKIYQVSIKASKDSDKVKCNAVRALGSILYLCSDKHILNDTSSGLEALINCAILGNDMKVRWNACRALGLVLSKNPDNILPSSWRDQVFPALCSLICDSPNFKVRTNAAWALYSCNSYGKYTVTLWKSITLAFENSQHVPSYIEYPHRDALIQQLCLTLSHVAACTEVPDLLNLWTEIGEYVHDISNYIKQFQETIVPEKVGDLIKAQSQLEKYIKSAPSSEEQKIAQTLASIFERTKRYDNLDITI